MAFTQLNKDVLRQVAEEFGVDFTEEDPTKNQMIKDLDEEGITWKMYQEAFPDPEDEPEVEEKPEAPVKETKTEAAAEFKPASKVLVKMTRANGTYEVRGLRFTKAHPFLPVSPEDANYLVEDLEGFKIASPREVEEYYS